MTTNSDTVFDTLKDLNKLPVNGADRPEKLKNTPEEVFRLTCMILSEGRKREEILNKLLNLVFAQQRVLSELAEKMAEAEGDDKVSETKTRYHGMKEEILSLLDDQKIWNYLAVHEELVKKFPNLSTVAAAHHLNELSKLGKITKLTKGTYRAQPSTVSEQ